MGIYNSIQKTLYAKHMLLVLILSENW